MNDDDLPPLESPLPAPASPDPDTPPSNLLLFTGRPPRPATERALRAMSRSFDPFDGLLICHKTRWDDDAKPSPPPKLT